MAYKALYRTYRPQKFSEMIGQDHIVRTLQNSLAGQKISHAYLFSGPRGTGKTSVARIFAKALNCDHAPTSEPCGDCVSCREISESNNPDVVEIDAASNNGVDEIRDIREKVKFLPGGSKYKIYIIDEVHMLTQGAFNALLKTLEEPPKHVVFILATTEPHKVLPTILSRCQRFDFKTLSVKEIASQIEKVAKEENFQISKEAIIAIAEGAEGGMRDALSYLDQAASFTDSEISIDDVNSVTGNLNYDKIIELAYYFETRNINQALKTINDLVTMGKEINKIVSGMLQFYRDVLLYKNIDTSMFSKYIFNKEEFRTLVGDIDVKKIFYYVDILSEVQTKIKLTSTPNIYLDVAVIKMINMDAEDLDYRKRIKDLEEKIDLLPKSSIGEESIDNDRVSTLETKLARVINELSRLELHKLDERISKLEQFSNSKNENSDSLAEIESLKSELSQLSDQIGEAKILAEKNGNPEIFGKIEYLSQELETIKNKPSNPESEHNVLYDISQIKDKLENIELKLNQLLTPFAGTVPAAKRNKGKPNPDQLGLFSDEDVSDSQNPIDDIKSEEEEPEIQLAENPEDEQDNDEAKEEEYKNEISVLESEPVIDTQNVVSDEHDESYSEMAESKDLIENEDINLKAEEGKIVSDDSEIIQNPHSRLVRKINTDNHQDYIIQAPSLFDSSENVKKEQTDEMKTAPSVQSLKDLANDEYSTYSVAIVERILHSSRTPNAREDKGRIVNLWKTITKNAPKDLADAADLLNEGQVVAVGEKEFILTYPNTAMCNQVMKMKFKRDSLKLLADYLGDSYNYIALPENVWNEKRIEYINQYNIGVRFPKITPITDPNLTVEKENQEYINSQEKMVNKALKLFGENIVKIE